MSYYRRLVITVASMIDTPVHSTHFRNQPKLQAYQREYAQRKRAPGRQKVSKADRQLLEERYVKTKSLLEIGGLSEAPGTTLSSCVILPLSPLSSHTDIKGLHMCTHRSLASSGLLTYHEHD